MKALRRDGDAWLVTSGPTSGGAAVNELFDAVAICTGLHSKPRMPTVCGEFAGAVLHSSEVTEASLTGKNIVVVGGSRPVGNRVGGSRRRRDVDPRDPTQAPRAARTSPSRRRGARRTRSRGFDGATSGASRITSSA